MSARVTVTFGSAGAVAVVASCLVSPSVTVTTGSIGTHPVSDSSGPGRVPLVTTGVPGTTASVTTGVPEADDVCTVGGPVGLGTSLPGEKPNVVIVVVVVRVVGCEVVAVRSVCCVVIV